MAKKQPPFAMTVERDVIRQEIVAEFVLDEDKQGFEIRSPYSDDYDRSRISCKVTDIPAIIRTLQRIEKESKQ